VLVNPEILTREGEASTEEGCLSVPNIFDEIKRAAKVRVRAQDRNGTSFERDFDDILAVCIQHEMDHLEGRLFVDYLSDLKRERIRKKLDKDRKERASRPVAASAGARRAY
jgi:peptide deformylase